MFTMELFETGNQNILLVLGFEIQLRQICAFLIKSGNFLLKIWTSQKTMSHI